MRNRSRLSLLTMSLFGLALINIQCKDKNKESKQEDVVSNEKEQVDIEKSNYGSTPEGEQVYRYVLVNQNGMKVAIITYGGVITSLEIPDRNGISKDVVLGLGSLAQYEEESPYFGAIIGRYGNRIANGKFVLDGKEYQLAINNGPNHLHGGVKGFNKVVWKASEEKNDDSASLVLKYLSKDGEEGYPGNLEVQVTYTLKSDNALDIRYEATTDKKTVVNLTNHSYFNLSGDFSKTILDQEITINADRFLPVDETMIPTGEIAKVVGTPFDFRETKTIGKDIDSDNDQLQKGSGYDHCWVLNEPNSGVRLAATGYDPGSGRMLEVYTDEPGIQFYSSNFLNGTLPAKNGGTYARRSGFCLETEHYPDSPNHKSFPSVILNPGDVYLSKTTFKFLTK